MTSDLAKSLYVETLTTLYKASGNRVSRAFIAKVNAAHDAAEPKVQAWLQKWFKKYRLSLRRRLTTALAKADTEDKVRQAVEAAVGSSAADEFPELFEDLIADICSNLKSLGPNVSFEVVNQRTQGYLRNHAANYFKDFTDNEARGIQSAIADAMANAEDGYTIKSIVGNILKLPYVYYPDRKIDVNDWATLVARTETARAASFAQREALQSIGMKSWQWAVQSSGCDDCQDNDEQIVAIGDPFNSGDTESPAHGRCRCVCIPVMDELTSMDDDDSDNQPFDEDTAE